MLAFVIILGIIFVFLAVVLYFFCIAFVRKNIGNCDDVTDPCNEVLGEFREAIGREIHRVKALPHKWVEAKSFDGLTLKARYFDNNRSKTAILFHGYRSSALRDQACAIRLYSDLGFNVLLVDQRAHGESEGRLITFGVKERFDVLSWTDFVIKEYSPKKIILGGMSMGATTVLLAASENLPKEVKAVIADCGYTSPEEIIKSVGKRYFKINATPVIPFLNLFCRMFGGFSFRNISTEKSLKKCKIPVLLIHGSDDGFVPCEMSERAVKCCNDCSQLLKVERAHHGMSFLVDPKGVSAEIAEFLKKWHCA